MSFTEKLKINKGNITDAMIEQPTLIYQYGLKVEELNDKRNVLEERLEYFESNKAVTIRTKYARTKTKALSETMIKDLVNIDEEIVTKRQELIAVKKLLGLARLKMKSLEAKGISIENVGHNIREESKSGRITRSKL